MIWDACSQEPNAVLRWIECHPALGSYLTLGAIAAALWSGWVIVRAESKRNAARGRVTAFRLAPQIVTLLGDVERAKEIVRQAASSPPIVYPSLQNLLGHLSISANIPAEVLNDTWTLPPPTALAVAQLEVAIERHAGFVEAVGLQIIIMDETTKRDVMGKLNASLDAIGRLGAEVQLHCGSVSDRIVQKRRRRERIIRLLDRWRR